MLAEEILEKVQAQPERVITRDRLDLPARYDSVTRALKKLVDERKLIRVAPGTYAMRGSAPPKTKSVEDRIVARVRKSSRNVFLREDFEKYGSYDRVTRALQRLVKRAKLLPIGYGLYAKSQLSPFDGKPAPIVGMNTLAKEALKRLGKKVGSSSWEQAYNSGRSTQVPTGRTVAVEGRMRRRIGYDGKYVTFERS